MRTFVGFFNQEVITRANQADLNLPKYGFHLGVDCAACGKWQKWVTQTDEAMLGVKFYLPETPNGVLPL